MALALTMVLAVGLAAAADGPGQPFYAVRLAIEQLSLPSAANPGARLQAEMAQLDTRLAEVRQATQAGNEGALDAALAAYTTELGSLVGEHLWSPTDAGQIEASLATQAATLSAVGAAASRATLGAVQQALAINSSAQASVGVTPTPTPTTGNNGNGKEKGNSGAATATASPTSGASESTPTPQPTPTPSPTTGNNGNGKGKGKGKG